MHKKFSIFRGGQRESEHPKYKSFEYFEVGKEKASTLNIKVLNFFQYLNEKHFNLSKVKLRRLAP